MSKPLSLARTGGLAVLFASLLPAIALGAEPSAADRDTSRALYATGMQALTVHDFPAAERACGGAYALVKAPTSATCWARGLEGLGRLIEARDVFLEAARFPVKPDEPSVFTSARESSRAEADRLSKRVPTVTLIVSGPAESSPLHVTIDGASVASETARLPRKVNPGRHAVAVSASGFASTTLGVDVAEAEDRHVEITLLRRESQAEPAATAKGTARATPPPTAALIAGGVGAVGLGAGIVAGVAAGSKHGTLDRECAGSTCPPSAQGDLDAFHALRTWSTVGYVAGALGLVGGAVLWLTAPSATGPAVGVRVGPMSVAVGGIF